jgi:hypothetical protein
VLGANAAHPQAMLKVGNSHPSRDRLGRQIDRRRLELSLTVARQRVQWETPFSPSWDAAMAALEDVEREAWLIDEREPVAS